MKSSAQPIGRRTELREKEYLGLCASCQTASNCTYIRDLKRPVLQCEEFEGYSLRTTRKIIKNTSHQNDAQLNFRSEEKDLHQNKGLCSLCEDREACTYPKPEGGVWHCEEYR